MSVTMLVAGTWPALLVALPALSIGLAMIWRPAIFARWQADFYRKRYGIVAGPIGPGTRLFFRVQGIFIASIGFAIVWNALLR